MRLCRGAPAPALLRLRLVRKDTAEGIAAPARRHRLMRRGDRRPALAAAPRRLRVLRRGAALARRAAMAAAFAAAPALLLGDEVLKAEGAFGAGQDGAVAPQPDELTHHQRVALRSGPGSRQVSQSVEH